MVILFKKIKQGKTYWYLGENKWANGTSVRLWQKYIGTAERLKQLLEEGFKPQQVEVMQFGLIAALLKIEKELGFVKIVDGVVQKRDQGLSVGEHLLISIMNRLDQPLSKNRLGEWFSETILKRIYTVKGSYLSSQDFWNHWNLFNDEKIEHVQEKLLEKLVGEVSLEDLFYDPTNFTTYIEEHDKNKIPSFGHAKNGVKGLRQVNLALLTTRKDGIPLWHHTYEGRRNDVVEFREFMQILFRRIFHLHRKCKKITLILDKGNNSLTNFRLMREKIGLYVLGSLRPSMFPELLQVNLSEFKSVYVDDKGEETKFYTCVKRIYEGEARVVVTYNADLAYCNELSTKRAVNKALGDLYDLKRKLNTGKWDDRDTVFLKVNRIIGKPWLSGLFKYELVSKKVLSLSFELDEEAYEKKANTFGKNILFTDNLSLTAEEVIKGYRSKDVIEQQFKMLKNPYVIEFTPVWCWTDRMIKVHAFTCVMALLFLALLCRKARGAGLQLSQHRLVEQLKKMRKVVYLVGKDNVVVKNTSFNEVQRKLNQAFELKNY